MKCYSFLAHISNDVTMFARWDIMFDINYLDTNCTATHFSPKKGGNTFPKLMQLFKSWLRWDPKHQLSVEHWAYVINRSDAGHLVPFQKAGTHWSQWTPCDSGTSGCDHILGPGITICYRMNSMLIASHRIINRIINNDISDIDTSQIADMRYGDGDISSLTFVPYSALLTFTL